MEAVWILVGLVLGAAIGAGVFRHAARRREAEQTRAANERISALEASLEGERAAVAEGREALGSAREELAREQATRSALERSRVEDEERLKSLRGQFQALAGEVLKSSNEQFLQLARESFEKRESSHAQELEKRKQAIEHLVKPLDEKLSKLDKTTQEIEKARAGAYGDLKQRLDTLATTTHALDRSSNALATALRGSSQARGRWGEMALRNIVEFAGMVEHCDFIEQATDAAGNRPDMIVRIPGGMLIPVDAKVPFADYEKATRSEDREERDRFLTAHARAVTEKVRQLAKKDYAAQIEGEIDFTVMFVPAEPILTAAFERAPDLYNDALEKKVIIATPGSLLALLRTVGVYWQQEQTAKNAKEILEASRELYARVRTFTDHLGRVEKGLQGAVDGFNKAMSSLNSRVIPQGRKLEDLKVVTDDKKKLADRGGVESMVSAVPAIEGEPPADASAEAEAEAEAGDGSDPGSDDRAAIAESNGIGE